MVTLTFVRLDYDDSMGDGLVGSKMTNNVENNVVTEIDKNTEGLSLEKGVIEKTHQRDTIGVDLTRSDN